MSTLSVTIDELKRIGLPYRVMNGGKHHKIKVEGLPIIVCSVSCSDRLGEVKARSLVRRLIRQNGLGVAA
jgi:hypothetical protein